ncbi:T9SS type A sorting domain-containing protein [Ekhidna sp.]|uniref:T9SS type A sorting domain-containing protein n=1 Tax=Ekhidna sp. TaxID=2608089 RepID=UPI0032979263
MSLLRKLAKAIIYFIAILGCYTSVAQPDTLEIFELEYFFDVDPGFGNGTTITIGVPDTTVSLVETLTASGLATGFHTLGMRARNVAANPKYNVLDTGVLQIAPYDFIDPSLRSTGQWGITETRLVFVDVSDGAAVVNVDQIEYFFDTDPGIGSATLINSFAASSSVSIVETLTANGLPTGFHLLGMRARAEGGSWGITETRLVFVDQSDGGAIVNVDSLEYFFDIDPGVGNATVIDGFAASSSVSLVETLNASGLSLGFHLLGFRGKAEGGAWGLTETRVMFVDPSASGGLVNIDQIEYFFDTDPGVGNATLTAPFTASNQISIVNSLNASGLAEGFHSLGMRGRAEGGSWGMTEIRMLYVDQSGIIQDVTELEYFIDTDPGIGSATLITITTPAPSIVQDETLITNSLALGSHTVNVRARNQNGTWGLIESRPLDVVDIGPPLISSLQALPTNSSPLDITISFEEAVNSFDESDIQVSAGGSIQASSFTTVNDSTYTLILDLLAEGQIAIDIADSAAFTQDDNSATPEANTFVIKYDLTAPVVTVDALTTSDNSPALTGTVDDDTTSVSITVDGTMYNASTITGGIWTLNAGIIDPLADGIYDVMVSATDSAGNVGVDASVDELQISGSAFQALPATAITSTSFDANWSVGVDVQNYELEVSEMNDFSTLLTGYDPLVLTGNTVAVNGLDFSTEYFYRVRVRDNSNQLSTNSNTISLKTTIDAVTLTDSTALVQIFNALDGSNWSPAVNWETDRLRDWDGITLNGAKIRVSQVDFSGRGAQGAMPNPFTGGAVGGLSVLNTMNLSNNQIDGLMDFGATIISILDVSSNSLEFDDLEPLLGIATLSYDNQAPIFFVEYNAGDTIERPHLSSPILSIATGGTANTYSFSRNGSSLSQSGDFNISGATLEIVQIDFDNMGVFTGSVTNSLLPDLTLAVESQEVLAVADLSMLITDANDDPVTTSISGYLLEAIRRQQGYDTLERADDVSSTFIFPNVVLGNYLCGINPSDQASYIPTYFGDDFEWIRADTVFFREAANVQVRLTEVPGPLTGDGTLDVLIEEDFPGEGSRVDARRRASKRRCGLRRKRSGGRTGQDDDFELIAYGETDENGEFQFGFLPQGIYRFFVEYPGIPLDESAVVEFEVGEAGVSDTDFKLEAFATEDGIEINIQRVLGLIFSYFKDLHVYPNPASDIVKVRYRHLKAENVKGQLVDITGNILSSFDLQNGFDGYHEIDISEFSEGIYLLHIYDSNDRDGTVVSYRIVVND